MSDIVERLRDLRERFIFQGASEFAVSLADEIERLRAENTQAKLYVTELVESLWRKHYKTTAPDWKPLCDLIGVISQLDNMLTGLGRTEGLEAENIILREALKNHAEEAAKMVSAEPVAWAWKMNMSDITTSRPDASDLINHVPLYTSPQIAPNYSATLRGISDKSS